MAIRQDAVAGAKNIAAQKAGASQRLDLIASQSQDLEQRVVQTAMQSPVLSLDGELLDYEDIVDDIQPELADDEEWNQDFDRQTDEYETGESAEGIDFEYWEPVDQVTVLHREVLEKWGDDPDELEEIWGQIEFYFESGKFPDNANAELLDLISRLFKEFPAEEAGTESPTFEVRFVDNHVQATLLPSLADRLRINSSVTLPKGKSKQYKKEARGFIDQLQLRRKNLESLAEVLLEHIQSEFFIQNDLKTALSRLVPIQDLGELDVFSPVQMDKKYRSATGTLLVACDLGVFPLHLFWPSKAELLRMWLRFAFTEGVNSVKAQSDWIHENVGHIMDNYPIDDKRRELMLSLFQCNDSDIKNARKKLIEMETSR